MDYLSSPALSTLMTKLRNDAFFVQTCAVEVENAEYAAPLKPPTLYEGGRPRGRGTGSPIQAKGVRGSQEEVGGEKLCYAKPTCSSWPLKQGRMGDLSQLKDDLKQKITTWQR